MFTFSYKKLSENATYAMVAAMTILSLLFMGFFIAEPTVSRGQIQDTFTVSQVITGENSFTVSSSSVAMAGQLAGLTGGNATGSTQIVVTSNNSGGYYVDIAFFDNAGSEAMYGETTGSEAIRDLEVTGGVPIFGFAASTSALFGYTVISSSTNAGDTADGFEYSGSDCTTTGSNADGSCWMTPQTGAFTIIDTLDAAPTGATSSIIFKVNVPSGAAPTVVTDTYTATATLSLYLK